MKTLRIGIVLGMLLTLGFTNMGTARTANLSMTTPAKVGNNTLTVNAAALAPAGCATGGLGAGLVTGLTNVLVASGATLTGTAANELLLGRNTATTLDAGGGNDCLVGGAGADLNMRGRAGTDVCIGNGGADTFNADCETQIQ